MSNLIKIVIVGESSAGKSSLTARFMQDKFIDVYNPTIEDTYRKQIEVDGKSYCLEILDTSGQEEYRQISDEFIRICDVAIILYSVTSFKSFDKISFYLKRINTIKSPFTDFPIVLVGNKCDLNLKREVNIEDGEEKAKKLEYTFFETSALKGFNINEVFYQAVRETLKWRKNNKLDKKKHKHKCIII